MSKTVRLGSSTTLHVDVTVETEHESREVFSKIYHVEAAGRGFRPTPAAREYQVDVTDYAGQRVEMIFRSTRAGHVVMSANELRDFGTRWQHPRIVEQR